MVSRPSAVQSLGEQSTAFRAALVDQASSLLAFLLLLDGGMFAPSSPPTGLLERVFRYIDLHQDEFVQTLKEWVAIESDSVQPVPHFRRELLRMVALAADQLWRLGASVDSVDTSSQQLPDGQTLPVPPIILAELGNDPKKPTVCFYGHLDVQPARREDGWLTDPYTLTEVDGKLYGRGTTDNKGPVLAWINAVSTFRALDEDLPVNIKFVIEGMEEAGSLALEELVQKEKAGFFSSVDYVVISDNLWLSRTKPALTYGTRGNSYFSVEVKCRDQDFHSGTFGGILNEPMADLVALLGSLSPGIALHGRKPFLCSPPFLLLDAVTHLAILEDSSIQTLLEKYPELVPNLPMPPGFLPPGPCGPRPCLLASPGPGLSSEGSSQPRGDLWGGCFWVISVVFFLELLVPSQPDLRSLVDSSGRILIPGIYDHVAPLTEEEKRTYEAIDLDLEEYQNSSRVKKFLFDTKVKQHLDHIFSKRNSSNQMTVSMTLGLQPWVADVGDKQYLAAKRAIKTVFGTEPDVIRDGSTIPIARTFQDTIQKSVLLLPLGAADDGEHAQNEKINVLLLPLGAADDGEHAQNEKINRWNYIEGSKLFAAFFLEMAKLHSPWQEPSSLDLTY
ncbi:hypothetical protein CB1_001033019 [Camelus ferus]|nr:hypothetical protein CB1_001033019 [Camelus ferus]